MRMLSFVLVAALLFSTEPAPTHTKSHTSSSAENLLSRFSRKIVELQPQTIRPAQGYIHYPYLIPAGYYRQMWDWDGFFIGVHLANQQADDAKYLKWWAIGFATSADNQGYIAGCITPAGPRPIFGKFAMKPFLAQGAYFAAERLHDYSWIPPIWKPMQKVLTYRETTQYDPKWRLFFWDNAMQSGSDNNAALTNDPKDASAILGVDISTFQLREYLAMALIADHLHYDSEAEHYRQKATRLQSAILTELWSDNDDMFWNLRRDNGKQIRVVSYSNFVPLMQGLLPNDKGKEMVQRYLLNPDAMRTQYGFRSLSEQEPAYNNVPTIVPYSNWRGPIWINANYMDWIGLKQYGFSAEARELALNLAAMLDRDIDHWGSMHENYDAETGIGLAPTPDESPNHRFAGFVGWNMLALDMLQCELTETHCMTLKIPQAP